MCILYEWNLQLTPDHEAFHHHQQQQHPSYESFIIVRLSSWSFLIMALVRNGPSRYSLHKFHLFLLLHLLHLLAAAAKITEQGIVRAQDDSKVSAVIPCGSTATFRPKDVAYIESGGNGRGSPSCHWRFLFTGCRLAITCPSSRQLQPFCLGELEIKEEGSEVKRFCGNRGPKNLPLERETNVTYRTNSVFGSLGFRCRLVCAEEGENEDSDPKPMAPPLNCSCGLTIPDTKIINGQETKINEFRWMAGLVRKYGHTPFCGASLINSKYILTAAHCVAGRTPQNLEIVLNEHDTQSGTETKLPTVRRQVEAIYQHRSYTNRLDYDAAIIKLRDSVEEQMQDFTLFPVCLPPIAGPKRRYDGASVIVAGWGVTSEGGNVSPVLRKTNVTVMTDIACAASYPGSITARMLCAAAPAKDACQGDSGGPLVHLDGDKYTQIGVVSWGHGCARPSKPGVYSRVTEFVRWIAQTTADGRYCNE